MRETREGRTSPLIPWGWELGSNGMVNVSEPLINVVSTKQAKGIERLDQKVRVQDTESGLSVRKRRHPGE